MHPYGVHECEVSRAAAAAPAAPPLRPCSAAPAVYPSMPKLQGHIIENNVLEDGGYVWQEGCGVLAQNIGAAKVHKNPQHSRPCIP